MSFNEGSQLGKFYFGTQDANIYIMKNGEQYAIVNAEAQDEIPVCFKANTDGQYTITVNAEKVEMEYMHLIDNMTGADIDLLATPGVQRQQRCRRGRHYRLSDLRLLQRQRVGNQQHGPRHPASGRRDGPRAPQRDRRGRDLTQPQRGAGCVCDAPGEGRECQDTEDSGKMI